LISKETITSLIEIGKSLDWDDPTLEFRLRRIRDIARINSVDKNVWYPIVDKLDPSEIASLLIGLIATEEKLRRSGGSVVPAIWVFRAFEEHDLDAANKAGDWALKHTSNTYFPNFGFGETMSEAPRRKFASELRRRGNARELEEVAKAHRTRRKLETQRKHQ
jgi:hypothetical protein